MFAHTGGTIMEYKFSDRLANKTGNAIRDIFKLLASHEVITFAGGMPANENFELDFLNGLAHKVITKEGSKIFQYGATEGYAPLIESIQPFLADRGVVASRENILIVSGAQQGIDLTAKALLNKGDTVLVESPTYLAALQIFNTYEANIVPVDTDENGVVLADLEAKIKAHSPKIVYLIPTFQNPTGNSIPLENRKAIAKLVNREKVVLIEDDPYRDLRYRGTALPPIKSFDEDGCVIYLTSFSKIISPGLRVGAAVADPILLRKLTIGKQATDVHTSTLSQAIVDAFLRAGVLEGHIERSNDLYITKKDTMQQAIREHFPKGVKYTDPDGGLFIWAELPEHMNALELLNDAVKKNVAFIPGDHFFVGGIGKNTMRLNFSNSSCDNIVKGISILGKLIAEKGDLR